MPFFKTSSQFGTSQTPKQAGRQTFETSKGQSLTRSKETNSSQSRITTFGENSNIQDAPNKDLGEYHSEQFQRDPRLTEKKKGTKSKQSIDISTQSFAGTK